jgi:pescadillo protein
MGKLKAQGTSGSAVNYITRTRAIRKLQISLADFRRLCILKGIFPREPKNKKKILKGNTAPTTFYYTKDIQYLMHEPVLQKFREHKVFVRKLAKALGKGEKDQAKRLEENKPRYTLNHIIKERYPTFIDALRDLDDALSMIFLFAKMPQTEYIPASVVEECQKLAVDFQEYVIATKSLTKTFVSIKGFYYQAEIMGQTITWLVPFDFSVQVPHDVDFRVMSTFLEFYTTLCGFVNFKLMSELDHTVGSTAQIAQVNHEKQDTVNEIIERIPRKNATEKSDEKKDEFESSDLPSLVEIEKTHAKLAEFKRLFSNKVFYFSRETPTASLEFLVRSFSGTIEKEDLENPKITHFVIDRPLREEHKQMMNRVYVQPQWIYDCINAKTLIDVSNYEPGCKLPPHMSPFYEVKDGEYNPLEEETIVETEKDEMREMAIGMMSKRNRKLYDQIQYGKNKRQEEAAKIVSRKKALEK